MDMNETKHDAIAVLEHFIQEGHPVLFPVKGRSMLPFIVGDRDKVEFHPIKEKLKVGDIVMARTQEGYPVVHRIVAITSEEHIVLSGDGNLCFQEHSLRKNIIARACYVVRGDGSKKSLISKYSLIKWHCWMMLKPFRRILLAIMKVYERMLV